MSSSLGLTIEPTTGLFPRITRYPVDFSQPETQIRMLRNKPKYGLFSEAIAQAVRGRRVLDIGTGSGILAMLAVAHGAKKVVAVDREPIMAMTRAVLGSYQKAAFIELREGDVFDLGDGNEKFDVIISETIGYLGFEENIAPILSCARHRFGNSETVVIPSDMAVMLEPVHTGPKGKDHSPFLTLARSPTQSFERIEMSKPVTLGLPISPTMRIFDTWSARTATKVDSVAVHFAAGLPGAARITNKDNPNWPHCVVPLPNPAQVNAGGRVTCTLCLDPSDGESYEVATVFECADGTRIETGRFESTAIRTDLLLPAPKDIGAVVQEVELLLRSLDLFEQLV